MLRWLTQLLFSRKPPATATATATPAVSSRPAAGRRYPCSPVRVIDGDSLVADVELGFGLRMFAHCRLAGIDTPELTSPHPIERERARKAKAELEALASVGSAGEIECDGQDKYGRLLVRYYPNGWSESVNARLLREGLAREYDGGRR